MPNPIITRARALIATPDQWTKRAHARDAYGDEIDPFHSYATCFCLDGAVLRATAEHLGKMPEDYHDLDYTLDEIACTPEYQEASNLIGGVAYVNFNDDPETTHSDVLNRIDRVNS